MNKWNMSLALSWLGIILSCVVSLWSLCDGITLGYLVILTGWALIGIISYYLEG